MRDVPHLHVADVGYREPFRWPCDVSSASGASVAMYTGLATRSSEFILDLLVNDV
jgi:hypothetical protein